MHSLDIFIQNYFSLTRTPVLTEYMYVVSIFFDLSFVFVFVVLCIAMLVYLVRGFSYARLFLLPLISGGVIVLLSKYIFNVNRPIDSVITAFGQSFPSYHATMATILFGILMYIFDRFFSKIGRIIFNTLCVFSILTVSFSRIYLGVHWFSDVLGGICLGILVLWVSIVWNDSRLQIK